MSLQDRINSDITEAMKTKNVDKLAALRAVKASIMLEATKKGVPGINDQICLRLIAKLVKQRKDSADIYIEQDRKDLAIDEINQLAYLEVYLPEKIDENELKKIVKEVIDEIGASSQSDIGKCIGILIAKLDGKADGSLISKLVKEELLS